MSISHTNPDFASAPRENVRTTILLFAILFALLLASRLCHLDILWSDEDYHQAAAIQALHGKTLYRDLWYDKPPLNVAIYALFGARGGLILRFASAIYALSVCASAFHFARRLWSLREASVAASLSAVFLIFYFPAATITLEPDTLLILPHLWAVYFAWQRRPFSAGIIAGLGTLVSVKGLFVLAQAFILCAATSAEIGWLALGFLIPNAAGFAWMAAEGAFAGYLEQVWRWGLLYTAGAQLSVAAGLTRFANWSAFHAALVIGAAWCCWKDARWRWRWIVWIMISLAGAAAGWRFAPRYLDQLLPPLILVASRGFVLARAGRYRIVEALLVVALLVPMVRFGPRYVTLAAEELRRQPHEWSDTAMDRDSRDAARIILSLARPDSTLFVWGYRPNLYAYTRLDAASRFWDSQPLTGVPADRHLSGDASISPPGAGDWAAQNRAQLIRSHPDFIADGLSLYNPRLDIRRYPELARWLAQYCEAGRTAGTIIYRKCEAR